jgi:hypothetical protein
MVCGATLGARLLSIGIKQCRHAAACAVIAATALNWYSGQALYTLTETGTAGAAQKQST